LLSFSCVRGNFYVFFTSHCYFTHTRDTPSLLTRSLLVVFSYCPFLFL
jgi:hypothetical protein